jgi:Transglutaminase-like superfamily
MVDSQPRNFWTMNEEGKTSANHKPTRLAPDAVTGGIVRRLTLADWWLLGVVTAAQLGVGAALRVMPLSAWRRRAAVWRSFAQLAIRGSNQRLAWAIEATGRRLGSMSTCLIRALVAELVMDAHDGPMTLTIGVRRTAAGAFHAHAWLARNDRVLVGATRDEYLPMASWTGLPQ